MNTSGKQTAGKIESSTLKKWAVSLLDLVLDGEGHSRIYGEFCAREPKLRNTKQDAFSREYVPAKLALGCAYWVSCCTDHQILGKEEKNLFFKEVMRLFQSPKSLEDATRFSESLYASNADPDQSPALGIWVHFFHKLGLEAIRKDPGEGGSGLNAAFVFMMEAGDALKNIFETKFDEHYYASETIRTKQKEGAE